MFPRRSFLSISTFTLLSILTISACQISDQQESTVDTSSYDQIEKSLYRKAVEEGKLVWYCVYFNQELVDLIGQAFTKKYPGIEFEGFRNTASNLFQKLNIEQSAELNIADLYSTTDFGQILQLKEKEMLLKYQPSGKENLVEKYNELDPNNYFQVGALLPIVIGYNTELIDSEERPTTWKELIKDKYKDKIATGSGSSSGQVGTWALSMEQKYTWDYLIDFNQLNPQLSRSINDVVPALISKERAIGATTVGQILTRKSLGDPIDVIYPEDGTIVVVAPIAILENASHPNAAKLFLNFLNSQEYSKVISRYFEQPIHKQIKLRGGKSLTEVKTYTPEIEEIKQNILKVKEKWREEFGV